MALTPGTRLGPYEITAQIGAGGMGEVYRARDTRLDRTVAIKVAQERFSDRFEREARAVAALNHPHICQLYDVGPNYLVMEYLDGSPLTGPLPAGQAMAYAAQICDALEAAHRAGVVHRDLKPANILVTKGGVKLLDFGLAKIQAAVSGDGDTMTRSLTGAGTILGTLQYMSPEQLQGREADARSDIFSFGLVFYEMLTGKRAFEGSSPASVMAAILERPAPTLEPEGVNRVVSACLAKNPDDRFQSARDVKRAIEWSTTRAEGSAAAAPRSRRVWMAWAAVAIGAAALAAFGWLRPQGTQGGSVQDLTLTIVPPMASGIMPVGASTSQPLISPDGRSVVYRDASSTFQLRRLDAPAPEVLVRYQGTSGSWSPDSQSFAFDSSGELHRMRVPSGAPEVVAKAQGPVVGVAWSDSGVLLFTAVTTKSDLFVVRPGSVESQLVELPGLGAGSYFWPQFLPGTEDFIVAFEPDGAADAQIYLATLRDGQPSNPVKLMTNETAPQYTPAGGGHMLFVRDNTLFAQAFGGTPRQLRGDPQLVAERVSSAPGFRRGDFSVSRDGAVVWRPGQANTAQVTNFDRRGRRVGTTGPPGNILSVKLAQDEQHVLVASQTEQWLAEPNQSGKLTVSRVRGALTMLWSPDSARLLVPHPSQLFDRAVGAASAEQGAEHEIAKVPGLNRLEDVSPDGTVVLFTPGALATRVFAVRLDGPPEGRAPRAVVQTGEVVFNTRFSPDGRWIVFEAYPDLGQPGGIFVQSFPGLGLRRQIARSGQYPVWRKDGKEIVFLDKGQVWSIRVDPAGADLRFGRPEALFAVGPPGGVVDLTPLAVSRDGERFYLPQLIDQPDSNVIHVRMGWLKP